MEIDVVWGAGESTTELSAFDAALAEAGVHNYNLLQLSSVVPEEASVIKTGRHQQTHPTGSPVAVVLATLSSSTPGEELVAGLGWSTTSSGGIFMEATANSEPACREYLETSLEESKRLREWEWEENHYQTYSHTVEETGAVVVAATYPGYAMEWCEPDE